MPVFSTKSHFSGVFSRFFLQVSQYVCPDSLFCADESIPEQVPLMRANNITMRDSFVTGGDDNVCIKNDTANVLIENVVFENGHGASIGSIPDCSGCHGVVLRIAI